MISLQMGFLVMFEVSWEVIMDGIEESICLEIFISQEVRRVSKYLISASCI